MTIVEEFLITGSIHNVEINPVTLAGKEYFRRCNWCHVAPEKLLQLTRGVYQVHFCRACAFTHTEAVELFNKFERKGFGIYERR